MKFVRNAVLALVVAAGMAAPSFAHHSQSMFDLTTETTITGVITEVDWANPHTFYYMDVVGADGKKVTWSFEANAPNALNSVGWSEDTIKEGQKVSFIGNARKDGKPTMLVQSVKLPDGKTISTKAR